MVHLKSKSIYLILFLGMILFFKSLLFFKETPQAPKQFPNEGNGFRPLRVAHAGGGIDGKIYTNSYTALNGSLKKGFLYFEIDFSFTKDHQLVCLHDWKDNFKQSFGFKTKEKVTLQTFEELVSQNNPNFPNCTLTGLVKWMEENPSAYIITDIKERNIRALEMMVATLPNASKKVIPQIYDPENFNTVKNMGFEQIIWTLYRFQEPDEKVLSWAKTFKGAVAITMSRDRANLRFLQALTKLNLPTYVHTINSIRRYKKLAAKGITEIYTDFLSP